MTSGKRLDAFVLLSNQKLTPSCKHRPWNGMPPAEYIYRQYNTTSRALTTAGEITQAKLFWLESHKVWKIQRQSPSPTYYLQIDEFRPTSVRRADVETFLLTPNVDEWVGTLGMRYHTQLAKRKDLLAFNYSS